MSQDPLPSSSSNSSSSRKRRKSDVRQRKTSGKLSESGYDSGRSTAPKLAVTRQSSVDQNLQNDCTPDLYLMVAFLIFFFFMSLTQKAPEGENVKIADTLGQQGYNPCCAFPCLHNGICSQRGKVFECDCTGTGYTGRACNRPLAAVWFEANFLPTFETMMKGPWKSRWFWWWVDRFEFLHKLAMKYVCLSRFIMINQPTALNAISTYTTYEVYTNRNVYALHLPKIPENCPTQMGYLGPKRLPSPKDTFDRLFERQHFIPCHKGTNLYFITHAQYFTHQFFKKDSRKGIGYTWGLNEGVDMTILYGQDKERSNALRSFKDGKMKVTMIDGEDFPLIRSEDTKIFMVYPMGDSVSDMFARGPIGRDDNHMVYPKWAIGHPIFSMTPFLFVMATLWTREHNRVCDMLQRIHPDWEDEHLFQTARLVLTGLMIRMTLTEYVQHLSQYKFRIGYEPSVTHDTCYNYANRIEQEFVQLYHWHMMIPDVVRIEDQTYIYEKLLFSNNSVVFRHGFNRFLSSMFLNIAGKMSLHNHGPQTRYVGESVIKQGRHLRLQSFNNYRRSFNLPAYTSFLDICKNEDFAKDLASIYTDVDAMEFYTGLFAEAQEYGTTSASMVAMGGAWSVRGLIANPVGSPLWWRPSTFGGKEAMDVIRTTTLKDFICRNVRGAGCSKMHIAYSVPKSIQRDAVRVSKEIAKQRRIP